MENHQETFKVLSLRPGGIQQALILHPKIWFKVSQREQINV